MIFYNDSLRYQHDSRRTAVYAKNGMVATSQPLAAQVGRDILIAGGNAIDAAIATAAALTVVEPTGNGIGGDAFAIVWIDKKLHGLNASSVAPEQMTADKLAQLGHDKRVPLLGWLPVTVPGTPAAWSALNKRWGKLSLAETIQPAIDLAESGFPVSPTVAQLWDAEFNKFKNQLDDQLLFEEWQTVFCIDGKPPKPGQLFTSKRHAQTLSELANTHCDSFYRGDLAKKIDLSSRNAGGLIRAEDLASYSVEWVEPISSHYKGYDIWQIPPNGQGLVVLMALNILAQFDFSNRHDMDTIHHQIEAMKLAYTDGQAFITELDAMNIDMTELLSADYASQRRQQISSIAGQPLVGKPKSGGTVYLATADSMGNMVSFIQSNFYGFGSGVVVPETGIALHNRGHDFSLDPQHPNFLQPGKKTFHTIIPGFITQQQQSIQQAVGAFGVMGAYMQPQGQLQVLMNMIDFGLNPQAALDAPRWQWFGDKTVGIEPAFSTEIFNALQQKGHDISWADNLLIYGRGQIILRDPETGVLLGGTEKRTDGSIAIC